MRLAATSTVKSGHGCHSASYKSGGRRGSNCRRCLIDTGNGSIAGDTVEKASKSHLPNESGQKGIDLEQVFSNALHGFLLKQSSRLLLCLMGQ